MRFTEANVTVQDLTVNNFTIGVYMGGTDAHVNDVVVHLPVEGSSNSGLMVMQENVTATNVLVEADSWSRGYCAAIGKDNVYFENISEVNCSIIDAAPSSSNVVVVNAQNSNSLGSVVPSYLLMTTGTLSVAQNSQFWAVLSMSGGAVKFLNQARYAPFNDVLRTTAEGVVLARYAGVVG